MVDRSESTPAVATTPFTALAAPASERLYAVGDVHGRLDLLGLLLDAIDADAGSAAYTTVLLGDYIDRGPDAAGVLDHLVERGRGSRLAPLLGNHEQLLLAFLASPETGPAWMDIGGGATLASYGVTPPKMRTDVAAWAQASAELTAALPQAHAEFLQSCALGLTWQDHVFVHAGVRPGVALEEQRISDLTHIRRAFLGAPFPAPGATVVHGHTPVQEVVLKHGKIGVDTGAYATNLLSALRLHDGEAHVINSRGAIFPLPTAGPD